MFLAIALVGMAFGAQEKFRSHRVASGETVYSIAKKYKVSEAEIYRLNPDARNGVSANSVLIIPSEDVILAGSDPIKFKKHRVKRKETLYSIAEKYGVTVDDIKRHNKHLYSKQLKKGEKLQIPLGIKPVETQVTEVVESTTDSSTANMAKHTVQAKETKYGIARKYGITIAELDALNPEVPANFPIGTVLNVPTEAVVAESVIEEGEFEFYEVQPKEGFFRLKIKLGLSQEEIVALNPYAKDGLKEGMILKIPKESAAALEESAMTVDLETRIVNRETKTIALMLPFQLKKFESDSTDIRADVLKSRRSNAIRVAFDFYSGVLMAAEFAKDKGISVNLKVFDTEASDRKVSDIIKSGDLGGVDAVIGPLLQRNVEKAAASLKSDGVPVFSPLSNRTIKMSSNLFQTLPSDDMMEKAMLDFLAKEHEGKNMIVITDAKHSKQKTALQGIFPSAIYMQPREKGFLYVVDIDAKMSKDGRENWVVLESDDPVLVSNVVGLLNGMPPEYKVRLFTLNKSDVYDFSDILNSHLANLNFTFPSVSKSYKFEERNPFLVSYKNKYGVLPNRFAVRGFDITYDILLRLASADDVYDASNSDYETEYIENKFRYSKKFFSGYQNNALYIIKYNEELEFDVVK